MLLSRFMWIFIQRASRLFFTPFSSTPSGRLYYIKHMRQLSIVFVAIIGKNSDFFRFGNLHKNSRLFRINCTNKHTRIIAGTRTAIQANTCSITAYRYSDIDTAISIDPYRYNYIDTIISIPGYRFREFEISNLPKSPGLATLRQISFF